MSDWSDEETDITNIDAHDGDRDHDRAYDRRNQQALGRTWRKAYLNTRRTQPVELHHATVPPATAHHLGHHDYGAPEPVSVSPARR